MSKVDFIFLHGFLGLPVDWKNVIENIKNDLRGTEVSPNFLVLDYFNQPNLSPQNSFEKVTTEFIDAIESKTSSPRKILIGYSLGGRLALHIFEKKPELFERLICVSTHPGFKPSQVEDMIKRDSNDRYWSDLFLNGKWEEIIQKWNEQDIFSGSVNEPARDSSQYRRDLLAKALVNWSLSKQTDKRDVMRRFQKKVSLVVGERDKKFIELTRTFLKEAPDIGIKLIPSSGHRVLFDSPLELSRVIGASTLASKKK